MVGNICGNFLGFLTTRKDVMSTYLPLAWQQESTVNAVLFSEFSWSKEISITTGNGGAIGDKHDESLYMDAVQML